MQIRVAGVVTLILIFGCLSNNLKSIHLRPHKVNSGEVNWYSDSENVNRYLIKTQKDFANVVNLLISLMGHDIMYVGTFLGLL